MRCCSAKFRGPWGSSIRPARWRASRARKPPLADEAAARQRQFQPQQRQSRREGLRQLLLKRAAGMGRSVDTEIGHLTPGEIVLPNGMLDAETLARLKQRFAEAGLDMGRYTVGGDDDSINPATGAREFYEGDGGWGEEGAGWGDMATGDSPAGGVGGSDAGAGAGAGAGNADGSNSDLGGGGNSLGGGSEFDITEPGVNAPDDAPPFAPDEAETTGGGKSTSGGPGTGAKTGSKGGPGPSGSPLGPGLGKPSLGGGSGPSKNLGTTDDDDMPDLLAGITGTDRAAGPKGDYPDWPTGGGDRDGPSTTETFSKALRVRTH